MNDFVTRMYDDLKEECHSPMLHENMTIAHLMVHGQQVEEARDKRKCRVTKRAISFDYGLSKIRF